MPWVTARYGLRAANRPRPCLLVSLQVASLVGRAAPSYAANSTQRRRHAAGQPKPCLAAAGPKAAAEDNIGAPEGAHKGRRLYTAVQAHT